ncbi:MAG: hypothetical protein M0P01_13265 [Treponema sp.]|nr:hypothetical protein [Treponema sp.]
MWYYKTYKPDGTLTIGKTSGCTAKSAARAHCDNLLKSGLLYNGINRTFRQYAYGWFNNGSVWMQDRLACGTLDYPALSRYILKNCVLTCAYICCRILVTKNCRM